MTEGVRQVARRFFEEQDRLRGGPADELCAPDYSAHLASFPPMDLDGHRDFSAAFYAAFPDLQHSIEDILVERECAAVRFRLTGTNSGSFLGNPPSGRPVEVDGIALMKIEDGKVSRLFGQFDQLGLMQQLGAG